MLRTLYVRVCQSECNELCAQINATLEEHENQMLSARLAIGQIMTAVLAIYLLSSAAWSADSSVVLQVRIDGQRLYVYGEQCGAGYRGRAWRAADQPRRYGSRSFARRICSSCCIGQLVNQRCGAFAPPAWSLEHYAEHQADPQAVSVMRLRP